MHDIKYIRENPKAFDNAMAVRGLKPQSDKILQLDAQRREALSKLEGLRAEKNTIAKEIGKVKGQGGDATELFKKAEEVKASIAALESPESDELSDLLLSIPNMPDSDVPEGKTEEDNVELKKWGNKPEFSFKPLQHFDVGAKHGLDFEQSGKISGARFSTFTGNIAKLQRALANFMLDLHTNKHGYEEIHTPSLVRSSALVGTSQLPKFEEDLFKTTDGRYLISTSEITVTNMVAGQILKEQQLPMRYTCYGRNFRSEAGSAGRDTRGIIRQHEFSKVELVSIVKPEDSQAEHAKKLAAAEAVLQGLNLHYRVVDLCGGDLGFAAHRTFDIEVWLPGQDAYREISSVSSFGSFQARRMKARFKRENAKETEFLHTLNGTGVAMERLIVAVLENYQQENGDIAIPEGLKPYLNNLDFFK